MLTQRGVCASIWRRPPDHARECRVVFRLQRRLSIARHSDGGNLRGMKWDERVQTGPPMAA